MRSFAPVLFLCVALAGCDKLSDSLGPEGSLQSVHAIPDLQPVTFYIRDVAQATIDYTGNTGRLSVGVDTYPLRWETRVPDQSDPGIVLQKNATIAENIGYTFVLTGTAASPLLTTWEREQSEFPNLQTLRTQYGHAALGLGPIDMYLEFEGTNLAGAMPQATVAYQQDVSGIEVLDGEDYVLTITSQGNVADVLFRSQPFNLDSLTYVTFVVLDGAGLGTAPLIVRVLGSQSVTTLQDQDSLPQVRAINSVLDAGPVDFYVDDPMSLLIPNVDFQQVSPYVTPTVTGNDVPLAVTPAGDPVMLLTAEDDSLNLNPSQRSSVYLVGDFDALPLATVQYADDQRRIADFARLRLFQGSANYSFVDVYLVEDVANYLSTFPVIAGLGRYTASSYLLLDPGTYDLVITPSGAPQTVLAELLDVDLVATDVAGILITDNADPNVVDLVPYDDLP